MCFWQSKYSERGCRRFDTTTEIIANISTRMTLVLVVTVLKSALQRAFVLLQRYIDSRFLR